MRGAGPCYFISFPVCEAVLLLALWSRLILNLAGFLDAGAHIAGPARTAGTAAPRCSPPHTHSATRCVVAPTLSPGPPREASPSTMSAPSRGSHPWWDRPPHCLLAATVIRVAKQLAQGDRCCTRRDTCRNAPQLQAQRKAHEVQVGRGGAHRGTCRSARAWA